MTRSANRAKMAEGVLGQVAVGPKLFFIDEFPSSNATHEPNAEGSYLDEVRQPLAVMGRANVRAAALPPTACAKLLVRRDDDECRTFCHHVLRQWRNGRHVVIHQLAKLDPDANGRCVRVGVGVVQLHL